jgi:putative tryptophan/tyrosine transport system substrate-binding protein
VAQALDLELIIAPVRGANVRAEPEAYAEAISKARDDGAQALLAAASTTFSRDAGLIADLATEAGLPTFCDWRHTASAGCMLGYGASREHLRERTASFVARLFQGSPPGELPIEAPTVFDLAINLRVASQLNINLPESLLVRADELIE